MAIADFQQELDQQTYREYQRVEEAEKRQPWGGRYSAEQIGKAMVSWPELQEAHDSRPQAGVEVVDLRDAVDAVLADPKAREFAERNIMGGEPCNPPRVEVYSIRTHRERRVYPPASEFALQVAVLNAEAGAVDEWSARSTLLAEAKVAATYNQAVRIFRAIGRQVNPRHEPKPRLTSATLGWLKGPCDSCGHEIFEGDAIYWLRGSRSLRWHSSCGAPA